MKKFIWIANSLLFSAGLAFGGTAFWALPKQAVSDDENRLLRPFPQLNLQSVLSGKFEKGFEEYYNDHFPLRNQWIELANSLNSLKGSVEQEIRVINVTANTELESADSEEPEIAERDVTNSVPSEMNREASVEASVATDKETSSANLTTPEPEAETAVEVTSEPVTPVSSDNQNKPAVIKEETAENNKTENIEGEFSKIKGVIVTNGRVLQVFAGTKKSITPYINMLNKIRNRLPQDVVMYSMLIPSGSDFYLPSKINKGQLKEQENIQFAAQLLSPEIIAIPAYDMLLPHKNEYIYFKTDHHWTGLGAYYAYVAFANQAGFQPQDLNAMQFVKKSKTFLGSLYKYTKDPQLKKSPDTLEYYKVATESNVKVYSHTNHKSSFNGALYSEKNNSYLVFLEGDYPLIHINTPASGNRKIVIIKDSFANALIPYLAPHYSDIYVVDYRYFKGNLFELIQQNGIHELLYAHNTFAANSKAAVKFGNMMLNREQNGSPAQ